MKEEGSCILACNAFVADRGGATELCGPHDGLQHAAEGFVGIPRPAATTAARPKAPNRP